MKNRMHATAKQLTCHGNLALVQLRVEPPGEFTFKPGGPELQRGKLVITESTGQGVVGQLLAVNHTADYLLLTDADVLVGAKQNRVLNKSVLLAPYSKTAIDVSCIERLRWQYTTPNFESPKAVADMLLRKSKMDSFFVDTDENTLSAQSTQQTVWESVSKSLSKAGYKSNTESYAELAAHQARNQMPTACEPEPECNALVILEDRKVVSIDMFGNDACYRHYFPLLRDAAFRSHPATKTDPADRHEAFYKACEAVEQFMEQGRKTEEAYSGHGLMERSEGKQLAGFILSIQGQLVHTAGFSKTVKS